ncbi:MAG: radical SAM protein, partial [Kiritimatiellae bacterium]|nr:radical SAM protein [Kiritimatiellia bacterium]
MPDFGWFFDQQGREMQQARLFTPRPDPTYANPKFDEASVRVLIVRLSPFRDVESSISHLFLFDAVRRAEPRAFIDFVFFPPRHDRKLLLANKIPLLTGIQSWRSAEEFDLVLVSNSFVLEMLNLPYVLRHSGWPLFASERHGRFPPLILGGSNAGAARCLHPFIDGLFHGEGEEAVGEIVRARRVKAGGRVFVASPTARLLPLHYPLLNGPQAGTARLQIAYGCPFGCAFCFEGFEHKPYREIPAKELIDHARRLKTQVGCEEIELFAFNFNTHREIARLVMELGRIFYRVSFKSQRLDILAHTPWLLPLELAVGKCSFTLGIEGISERLRSFLNKNLTLGDIQKALHSLLQERIREIKLFYILTGYETQADTMEFRDFARWLAQTRQAGNPGIRVIFSFGLLVRMPGTPFEHDRLFLDEAEWKPIVNSVSSACEDQGFEFRLAMEWPDYVATQVLSLSDESVAQPMSEADICYEGRLPRADMEKVRAWHKPRPHRPLPTYPPKVSVPVLVPPDDLTVFQGLMNRKARLKPVYV